MFGFISPFLIVGISVLILRSFMRDMKPWERRLLAFGFVFQLFGIVAIIGVTKYYYGGGDMLNYHEHGNRIANMWSTNLTAFGPMVWELLIQTGGAELAPYGAGTATGSMHAMGAILGLATGGSLFSSCAIVGFGGFFSRLIIYRLMRSELESRYWRPIMIATMLMPSVVYWSSGLLKESVALAVLGPLMWGARKLTRKHNRLAGLFPLALGLVVCGLFKAYLLPPFVLAAAAWFYVARSRRNGVVTTTIKPGRLILAGAAAIALLLVIGTIMPRYDFRTIQSQVAKEQHQGSYVSGGSDFRLQGSAPSSTAGFLLTAPWAVVTALFRPAVIEARNPLSLLNSLETLVLLIMLFQAVSRNGILKCVQRIRSSGLLTFCSVFTLVLAMGVGFSTTNMGTLSRYRMPLVPFFVVVLVVLRDRESKTLASRTSSLGSPASGL